MLIRPNPERLFLSAMRRLVNLSTTPAKGSLQWEIADATERHFRFGGWVSFAGIFDVRDLAAIHGNGMIGYSSSPSQSDVETASAVLTKDRFSFQENEFKPERSEWLRGLVTASTTKETWFALDRKILFEEIGRPNLNAKGSSKEIRQWLQQMDVKQWLSVASSSEQIYAGREYMSIGLRIHEEAFLTHFLALFSLWKNSELKPEEIIWAKRVAKNAAQGDWQVMIDEGAGDIVGITGRWDLLDDQGKILGRESLSLVLGVDGTASVRVSEDAVDITEAVFPKKKGALPSSRIREPVKAEAASSTEENR